MVFSYFFSLVFFFLKFDFLLFWFWELWVGKFCFIVVNRFFFLGFKFFNNVFFFCDMVYWFGLVICGCMFCVVFNIIFLVIRYWVVVMFCFLVIFVSLMIYGLVLDFMCFCWMFCLWWVWNLLGCFWMYLRYWRRGW